MATSYPTSVDSFTDPTATNPMNSPSHAGEHTNVNDAVNAIETHLGTTGAPNFLALSGGTMSGPLAMGTNKVTGLANGSATSDAAAYGQVPVNTDEAQWLPNTAYALGNIVSLSYNRYVCITAHTSAATIDTSKFVPLGQQPIQAGIRRFPGFIPCAAYSVRVAAGNVDSDGTQTKCMSRVYITFQFPVDEIVLVYGGTRWDAGVQTNDAGTITAGFENPSNTTTPVTFNGGSLSGTISQSNYLFSDPIPVVGSAPEYAPGFPTAGTEFNYAWIRTYGVATGSSSKIPSCGASEGSGQSGEGMIYSTSTASDQTQGNSALSGSPVSPNNNCVRPVMILGRPSTGRVPYIYVEGDSMVLAGTSYGGDTGTGAKPGGYLGRALQPLGVSFLLNGSPGEEIPGVGGPITALQDQRWLNGPNPNFDSVWVGATDIITEYGVNNINPSIATMTVAQLQAAELAWWLYLHRRNGGLLSRVYQTTLPPHTTSTDGWVTTGNQAINNTTENTTRISFNSWLRDGAPITGYGTTSVIAVAVGTVGAARCSVYAAAGTLTTPSSGQPVGGSHPLTAIFECATNVESSLNSGIWKANYTADGIHPDPTGAAAAAVCVPTSGIFAVA